MVLLLPRTPISNTKDTKAQYLVLVLMGRFRGTKVIYDELVALGTTGKHGAQIMAGTKSPENKYETKHLFCFILYQEIVFPPLDFYRGKWLQFVGN